MLKKTIIIGIIALLSLSFIVFAINIKSIADVQKKIGNNTIIKAELLDRNYIPYNADAFNVIYKGKNMILLIPQKESFTLTETQQIKYNR